jgi:GntR family transcriptional regulator
MAPRKRNRAAPASVGKRHEAADLIELLTPDRDLAEPVYLQLVRRFTEMIESGRIIAGQGLPSERVLAERLEISRTTVRRAYDELRAQALLVSQGRAGATIQAPPRLSPRLGRLKGFTEEMQELGIEPSTRVLEYGVTQDRLMASIFNRPSTAKFLRLIRLRLGDLVPLSRELAWYDLSCVQELADWDMSGSAYRFIQERCGVRLASAEQTIEAVLSSPAENEAFGFEEPSPCLLIKRRTFSPSGQLIEYVEGTFRGDSYAYRLNLNDA